MPDMNEDGRNLPVDGATIIKDGKYGTSKKSPMCLRDVYTKDKKYVQWVRDHISIQSAKDMQRLKLYIMTRDDNKKDRLRAAHGIHAPAAKAKAMPKLRAQARARAPEDEPPMEWQYVGPHAGRAVMVAVVVDGVPVKLVDVLAPELNEEDTEIAQEMLQTLQAVLPEADGP